MPLYRITEEGGGFESMDYKESTVQWTQAKMLNTLEAQKEKEMR